MLRYALPLLIAASALAQAPAATPQAPASTIRTDVQLVTVDVVVTDSKGKPVPGLSQADFTVRENKNPQPIKGFEVHTGTSTPSSSTPPPGTFSNTPQTRNGSVDVLLIDVLNTPATAQGYLRDQLVKFLAAEKPGRQVAIFLLSTRLSMLQDFTTDPLILKQAVKLQGTKFSPLLNKELKDTPSYQMSEALSQAADMDPGGAELFLGIQTRLLDMNAYTMAQQTVDRARITMDALEQISRYLAGVPGRKNLLWFSGSFPIVIQRDIQTTGDPWAGDQNLSVPFQHTLNVLAQAQVAVYPIDSRGISVAPSFTSDQPSRMADYQHTKQVYGTNSLTPRDDQFNTDQANEHNTMNSLADGTGGRAFYNTNALADVMDQAVNDGENYYTLLYTPPPGGKPGEFRNLDVQLNKPGLKLDFRKGYYAASNVVPTPQALAASLGRAMSPDATDSSEIALRIAPSIAKNPNPADVVGLKMAGPQPEMYVLNFSVDLTGLHFVQGADGKMRGTLLLGTAIYAKNGNVIDSRVERTPFTLDMNTYKQMLQQGMGYDFTVATPANADGSVRIAAQDADTGRIGTLHLRDSQLRAATSKPKS
jgi:VWFA-related protein